ncbi:hypothetical protein Trydic_g3791 [Trypoxylus dichotomus]
MAAWQKASHFSSPKQGGRNPSLFHPRDFSPYKYGVLIACIPKPVPSGQRGLIYGTLGAPIKRRGSAALPNRASSLFRPAHVKRAHNFRTTSPNRVRLLTNPTRDFHIGCHATR